MDIISTSDNKICFKASAYLSHRVGDGGMLLGTNEICIHTEKGTPYEKGYIFKYKDRTEALKYSGEIINQLKSIFKQ